MARLGMTSGLLVLLLAASGGPSVVHAQGLDESLYIGGFVSQGYLNTSENDYLVSRSVNGTAEFTEAAITFSANPMDRLRIGIQFMARNFGSTGNGQVQVDWAFGDYRLHDELGFRAGRVKLPHGLYNEVRDIDLARTSVFLPSGVYNEKMRDLLLAYEGAGAYGSLILGSVGEVEYHVYGGTLNVSDSTKGVWDDNAEASANINAILLGLANDAENGWEPGTTEVAFTDVTNSEVTFPWVWGGSLVWNTPMDGFRLGVSFMSGRFNYQGTLHFDVETPEPEADRYSISSEMDETTDIDYITIASAEYTKGDLILATEYAGSQFGNNKSNDSYVMAGYRVSDLFSLATYYSVSYGNKNDKTGASFEEVGIPDYYAWLKDLTLSTRFDLTPYWLLKFEYHFFDGVDQTKAPSFEQALTDPLSKHWGMLTAKTTFAF